MNTTELRIEMLRHNDTGATLAEALGVTRQTLSRKMNCTDADFTQGEIATIKDRYQLSSERVSAIFFAEDVSDKDTKEVN